ncbi:MAG: hypothetical protein ACYDEJ_14185 [Desulfitobacteriaceae bacterium]
MDKTSKILILVEGAKTDLRLMKHLLHIYGIDNNHEVVSYDTNIYVLYNDMFADGDPSSIDLLQLLKERESDPIKKEIFNNHYSDILLVFDLDPQDPQFSADKIMEMTQFFVESSDMGKLYINYPMVEAFYHMKSIPDDDYNNYVVSLTELSEKTYKQRVNQENRNHDYSKFAVNHIECNTVIRQNIDKAWCISEIERLEDLLPESIKVQRKQLSKIVDCKTISVLCTSAFYFQCAR